MKEVTDKYVWSNIDHEKYRTYVFPFEVKITIVNPKLLYVSESGGHRVLDGNDVAHYIPDGWIHLYWETNDENAFRF